MQPSSLKDVVFYTMSVPSRLWRDRQAPHPLVRLLRSQA